jgi:hypothetical protein
MTNIRQQLDGTVAADDVDVQRRRLIAADCGLVCPQQQDLPASMQQL